MKRYTARHTMGKTSSVKEQLFGDTRRYEKLLAPVVAQLKTRYPNDRLRDIFESLPHRSISVGPMSMCERLLRDLGSPVDDRLLQAVGTICLHISTHDDLIDEPPAGLSQKAALLYGGNISLLTGVRLLLDTLDKEKADFVWQQINRNHLMQQRCAELLWEGAPRTFAQYRRGIEHIGSLVAIGMCAALGSAGRQDLWPDLEKVCLHYGLVLQLMDDIAEVDEDRLSGYHSFPLLEGPPYSQTFAKMYEYLGLAEKLTDRGWTHTRELFTMANALADRLKNEL